MSLSNLIAVKAGCSHPEAKQIVRPPTGPRGGRRAGRHPWPAAGGPVRFDLLLRLVLGAWRLREPAWNPWPCVEFVGHGQNLKLGEKKIIMKLGIFLRH